MNRSQLIDEISENNVELSRDDVRTVLSSLEQVVLDSMQNGNSVELRGFGTFEPKLRAARTGRNPKTGQPIHIHKKFVPEFRPVTQLKAAVSKLTESLL